MSFKNEQASWRQHRKENYRKKNAVKKLATGAITKEEFELLPDLGWYVSRLPSRQV